MTRRLPGADRRSMRADQRGVALITVLAVIAFTFLVIGALFGLLSASMKVTEAAERTAREARAADAAVETAVNRMRTQPCEGVGQAYLTDVEFDQSTASTADDVQVDVTCSPAGDAASSETDQVRIVGSEGYQGPLEWTADCAVNAADGCLSWAALGGVPGDLGDRNISLIHGGEQPLQFGSGVSVRTGAAALRSDTDTPAIRLGGQYRQGDSGLGATGTDCGVLAGASGDGRGQVDDIDGSPECGNAEVGSLPTVGTGAVALTAPASIPTCTGSVITFQPGRYDSAQTDAVNALTGGGCTDKTFHFPQGIYEFQGDELVFADRGSFYVFGQPNGWSAPAGLVGTPAGTEPDAMLCDPNQRGATIVLNGWTALRHTGGRVAICPAVPLDVNGAELDPYAGIEQNPGVPTSVDVTGIQRTGWGNGIGDVDFRCRTIGVPPTTADYPDGIFGACRPERRYDLLLTTQGRGPVESLRVLLTANESASTPNNLVEDRQTLMRLYSSVGTELCSTGWMSGMPNGGLTGSFDMKGFGNCANRAIDQEQLGGARIRVDHRMTLPFAFVRQPFTLIEAEVEVNAIEGPATTAASGSSGGPMVSGYDQPDNALVSDGALAVPQMPCADLVCAYDDSADPIVNAAARPFVHEIELGGFDFPAPFDGSAELDPQVDTLRAIVGVSPTSTSIPASWGPALQDLFDVQNFLIPTQTYLELTTPAGSRCVVQGQGMNSDQELAFDLLDPDYWVGSCTLSVSTMTDLQDAALTLRFSVPCVQNYFNDPNRCLRENAFEDSGRVWQIRPPGIDHVMLTTVTDTYAGVPPSSRVTIDVTDQAESSAFNVYGRTWLPLSDLDLRWTGGAGATPLFGGNLMVHGLASWMDDGASMGMVCCAPPESRTVDLVATIDDDAGNPVERLVQTVDFIDVDESSGNPVYSQGFGVDVLDYRTCGRGGCASVLGNSANNNGVVDPP